MFRTSQTVRLRSRLVRGAAALCLPALVAFGCEPLDEGGGPEEVRYADLEDLGSHEDIVAEDITHDSVALASTRWSKPVDVVSLDDAGLTAPSEGLVPRNTTLPNTVCLIPSMCDADGDGWAGPWCAGEPYDVNNANHRQWAAQTQCTHDKTGNWTTCYDPAMAKLVGTKMCPVDSIQSSQIESQECDAARTTLVPVAGGGWKAVLATGQLDLMKKHLRTAKATSLGLTETNWQPWVNLLKSVRPNKAEVSGDGIDNDCDGYVDESYGNPLSTSATTGNGTLTFTLNVNDAAIKSFANTIDVRVFPLAAVYDATHLRNLSLGNGKTYLPADPPNYVKEYRAAYSGGSTVNLTVNGLPNTGGIWALEVNFLKKTVLKVGLITRTTYTQLSCVNADGTMADPATCSPSKYNDRVVGDAYLVATAKYNGTTVDATSKTRRDIVNTALKEWYRAKTGTVSFQRNTWFNPGTAVAAGEKYTKNNRYQLEWCSEFVDWVYSAVNAKLDLNPNNEDDLATYHLAPWFDTHSTMLLDSDANDAFAEGTAQFGDYMMLGCYDGSETCVGEHKGMHSALYLATSVQWGWGGQYLVPHVRLWKLGGNEGNVTIHLQAEDLTANYHRGLGIAPNPATLP